MVEKREEYQRYIKLFRSALGMVKSRQDRTLLSRIPRDEIRNILILGDRHPLGDQIIVIVPLMSAILRNFQMQKFMFMKRAAVLFRGEQFQGRVFPFVQNDDDLILTEENIKPLHGFLKEHQINFVISNPHDFKIIERIQMGGHNGIYIAL